MRWEDERYVRVYVRDTTDWVALGWEAQALLVLTMRKMDRAGILELGKSRVRGLAALVAMPVEVVERALPVLLEDGCFVLNGSTLVMPNFIEAQEAAQSDKHRKRESRARARDQAAASGHDSSRNVTGCPEQVTGGPAESREVTPYCAVPYRTEEAPPSRERARGEGEDQDQQSRGTVGPKATTPSVDVAPASPLPAPGGHPTEGATLSAEQAARETARAIGSQDRLRVLADADLDARYPATGRLLAWLRDHGAPLEYPAKGSGRAAAEAACQREPLEVAGPRVLAAYQANPRPGLGWYLHDLAPELDRRRPTAATDIRFGIAPPAPAEAFGEGGDRAIE